MHVIYALEAGGLENGLVNILNRADTGRYRHAIICLTKSGSFESRITAPGIRVYALNKKPGTDIAMFLSLWRLLRTLKPAIVHTRNMAALEAHLLWPLFPRCRRVHGEHGRDVSDLHGTNKRYIWLRRVLQPFIQRFICVSEDLAAWLRGTVQVPARKVTQIYNGVDHDRFALDATDFSLLPSGFIGDDEPVILGMVGRLAAVKDQLRLLCAIEHILAQRPELSHRLRVIVIGDGPMRRELEDRARHLGGMVWFAGERSDVPALMTLMGVFVLPSLGEGISNTILEAMSAGLPVVASDVGGNPELVEDGVTGRLFPVGDDKALAEVLLPLIDDATQRRDMGRAGRQRVCERHDWNRTVEAYLRVYDDVLGREPGTPT